MPNKVSVPSLGHNCNLLTMLCYTNCRRTGTKYGYLVLLYAFRSLLLAIHSFPSPRTPDRPPLRPRQATSTGGKCSVASTCRLLVVFRTLWNGNNKNKTCRWVTLPFATRISRPTPHDGTRFPRRVPTMNW